MSAAGTAASRGAVLGLLACLGWVVSGCTWQSYAVTRGIRSVTGARTQVHAIMPLTSTLRTYRVIELHDLENLLPGRMPSELEGYLNDVLAEQLQKVASSPTVVRVDPNLLFDPTPAPSQPAVPTLVFEGFIDDYDPGYVGLRLAELGFNHLVVTVRIQLRDKATGQEIGAASVTAQDDRVTATARGAINRLVDHIRAFVGAGYAR